MCIKQTPSTAVRVNKHATWPTTFEGRHSIEKASLSDIPYLKYNI